MADKDKDKQAELTPWQKQHAAFEKKKAAEAAKQAREERRQKQPIKVVTVVIYLLTYVKKIFHVTVN